MKRKIINTVTIILIIYTAIGLFSCSKDDENPQPLPSLEVSEVVVLNAKQLKVSFNQNIEQNTAQDIANYTLLLNKTTVAITQAKVAEKEVIINLKEVLQTGSYTLNINNIHSKEESKPAEKHTYKFSYKMPVTIEKVEVLSKELIKLYFTKNIDPETCKNIKNYTLFKDGKDIKTYIIVRDNGDKEVSTDDNWGEIITGGSEVTIRIRNNNLFLKTGNYKLETKNLKYSDKSPFTGNFPEFTYKNPPKWYKQVDLPVKTCNLSDALTWTYFDCRKNKTITFNTLHELVNDKQWCIAFGFDGYRMYIKTRTRIELANKDITDSSLNQKDFYKKYVNGIDIISADMRTEENAKQKYLFWCVKDAPNYYELNKNRDTKTPFKLLKRVLWFVLPKEIHLSSSYQECRMQITKIYKEETHPNPVPGDYTYHLSFIYIMRDNKWESFGEL